MRATTYLRIGLLIALGMAFLATHEVYSQRGGEKGGRTAGHKAPTAPKQAGAGPAMTRPAAGPAAEPRTGAHTDGPKAGPGTSARTGGPKETARGPGNVPKTA